MFTQIEFGNRLKGFRRQLEMTQKELASKIGASEQAVSKWENGDCLPDVYHLKLLALALHVSADRLLETESESKEQVKETILSGGAVFEIVERPETILAGKVLYAKDFSDIAGFHQAIELSAEKEQDFFKGLAEPSLPVNDIHLSVNFWRSEESRAYGFVRQVLTDAQPEGVDVYKLPSSLYLRAHTGPHTAQLLSKEQCEPWELFSYLREYLMPAHGYKMAENGAQELEIFDTAEHKSGYAYLPVMPR